MTAPKTSARLRPLLRGVGQACPRVAVVTASYGAGHNSVARELERALAAAGCDVEVHDVVSLLPWRLGPMLRVLYYWQLRHRPGSWGAALDMLQPGHGVYRVATLLLRVAVGPIVRATRGCDLVITTHPFGAQALGQARSAGRLTAPAVTYLTDLSVHALWVHPHIDLHLAIHDVAAQEAQHWGGSTVVVRPLVPDDAATGADSGEGPSTELGDPLSSYGLTLPRALITGGSLGVGELEATARDVLGTGIMTPVVLCGTDDRLRAGLSRIAGVIALGWRTDVAALMATSDCVIQNAGGFTSLEALASGTPVLTYRPIPGHGITNSINLEAAGLIPWARDAEDLALHLHTASLAERIDRLPTTTLDVVAALLGDLEPALAA